jgi:predicted dehydrogenase
MVLSSWYQDYLTLLSAIPEIEREKLDWKRFLGSAPDQPFDLLRFARWRWFWDFGGGHLTDLYSHWGDAIHWIMGQDTPQAVQAMGGNNALPKFQCPDTINAVYQYNGYHVVYDGTLVGSLEGGTIVFRGSDAMMRLNRTGFVVYQERLVPFENTQYPEPEMTVRSRGDGTPAHVKNWLDCVRSRKEPNAGVKSSVASARAAHLGNLAYRKARNG